MLTRPQSILGQRLFVLALMALSLAAGLLAHYLTAQ